MALHHASSGEIIDIRPLGAALIETQSRALFKSAHLEVARVVLMAEEEIPAHKLASEVMIQCLEGQVECNIDNEPRTLFPGDLVCLAAATTYGLRAVEDSSLLITMLLLDMPEDSEFKRLWP